MPEQHQPQSAASVEPEPWVLAHNPEIGMVFRCHHCSNIHLSLGPAHLQVTPEAFMAVVDLIQRSASNFELMLEAERESGCD